MSLRRRSSANALNAASTLQLDEHVASTAADDVEEGDDKRSDDLSADGSHATEGGADEDKEQFENRDYKRHKVLKLWLPL